MFGRGAAFNTNLFYKEYIIYICVGQEFVILKTIGMNDKILLPHSHKIINIAKKYGQRDNLAIWDKYNSNMGVFLNLEEHNKNTNQVVFL